LMREAAKAEIAMKAVGDTRIDDLLKEMGIVRSALTGDKAGAILKAGERLWQMKTGDKVDQLLRYYYKAQGKAAKGAGLKPNTLGEQIKQSKPGKLGDLLGNQRGAIGDNPQVKSENFKAWFGDWEKAPKQASKIVDESGKPLVVYHGGNDEVSNFSRGANRGWSGVAFFTDDSGVAERYTTNQLGRGINRDKNAGKITKVYLDIKNPLYGDSSYNWDEIKNTFSPEEIYKKVQNTPIADYIGDLAEQNEMLPQELIKEYWDDLYEPLAKGMAIPSEGDALANAPAVKFLHATGLYDDFMKRNKYDGIIYPDAEVGGNTYLPLSPTQIKSATGNSGAFSPTNPDIRGSVTGRGKYPFGTLAGTAGIAGGALTLAEIVSRKRKKEKK
jgi:hypothetical protein